MADADLNALVALVERQVPDADRAAIERALAENGRDAMAAICALLGAPAAPAAPAAEPAPDLSVQNQATFDHLRATYDDLDARARAYLSTKR